MLVVTPRFPYPVVGGDRLRIINVCRELARDNELTLASLCATREELGAVVPTDIFTTVHRVFYPAWRSMLNVLSAMPTREPLQVAYFRSRELHRLVDRLSPSHDVLLAHLARTADYVCGRGLDAIVEMTDAVSMNYSRVRERGAHVGPLRAWLYGRECDRIMAYEQELARRAELCVFVSEVDRDFLYGDRPEHLLNTMVCSNGVDCDAFPFAFEHGANRVCFIGNMTTLQNLDAAHYFAEEVLPRVRTRVPEATFEVVGRIDDKGRRVLADIPGVRVTGFVPDVAAAVRGATVGVCPMRLGAGVQNKVLEYMSLGIPAIVSSLAYEGLTARSGAEVIVADDADAVAEHVGRILRNRAEALGMAEAARRYVERKHSWSALLAPLRKHIASL